MIKPTRISFGGTAAIVTSMALLAGLDAANAGKATVMGALLIAAIADNLTDSLSVHMYQESERLEQREAFAGTVTNFGTRLIVCLTFVLIVALFWRHAAAVCGLVWGMMNMSIKETLCSFGVRAANRHGANGMTAPVDLAVSILLPGKIMVIFTLGLSSLWHL